jgi:hypothetical protein
MQWLDLAEQVRQGSVPAKPGEQDATRGFGIVRSGPYRRWRDQTVAGAPAAVVRAAPSTKPQ